MHPVIQVADTVPTQVLAGVSAGLRTANTALVGPSGHAILAAWALDPASNALCGGLIGYNAWGWLYIERLWVTETRRGAGLGSRLIAAAEAEAVRRGCRNAWIDTFNPAALRLYRSLGYVEFGALVDFPPGHTRTFLRKGLDGDTAGDALGGRRTPGSGDAGPA